MNKQRGGTLLGLIIGALIGLGVALAVAVYVTKVPVPFMNKSPTHNTDTDAAEERKNKDWNPNATLAGKTPVIPTPPAASEATPAPALSPPVVMVTPPKSGTSSGTISVKPGSGLGNPSAPAVSADPLGDLANAANARANAASHSAPVAAAGVPVFGATSDPFNYFIQAGAYRTPEDAEQQRAKLVLLGLQAKVSEREQAGRTVYRVRLGPFDKKEDAEKAKARLDRNSVETALVRVQR